MKNSTHNFGENMPRDPKERGESQRPKNRAKIKPCRREAEVAAKEGGKKKMKSAPTSSEDWQARISSPEQRTAVVRPHTAKKIELSGRRCKSGPPKEGLMKLASSKKRDQKSKKIGLRTEKTRQDSRGSVQAGGDAPDPKRETPSHP